MSQLDFCNDASRIPFSLEAPRESIERQLIEMLLRCCELNEALSNRVDFLEERFELMEMEVMS